MRVLFAKATAAILAAGVLASGPGAAGADPVSDFYKGAQLDIVVGSAPGGGFDAYARFLGRHISRFIPGNPTIVVKNMPGAGGLIAGNYVFNQAPRDGSVIAHVQYTLTIDQISEAPNLKLDMRRFSWIGSMNILSTTCALGPHVSVNEAEDLRRREFIVGASQGGGSTVAVPGMLNALVQTKFRIVLGYTGTNEVLLGMERKEVDGLCGLGWDSALVQARSALETGKLKFVLDIGNNPHPELRKRGVPHVMDMMPEGPDKEVLKVLLSVQTYGRPFAAPPGVPADRLAALQKAFADTLKDEAFLADAAKSQLEIQYMAADEIMKNINVAFDAPEHVRKKAIDVMNRSNQK